MAGSLLFLVVVVVVAGSLPQSSSSPPPPQLGPSSSRSRCQRCGVARAERGVARVSVKGCRVGRGVGEVRGTKARGRKRRRRHEGRVGGDSVREASFPTKY
jgi:hypothetical protein